MDALELKRALCEELLEQSGLEERRPYLGMSGIGRCAREQYFQFVDGKADLGEQAQWRCWLGYLFEGGLVRLLESRLGKVTWDVVEVVAAFDARFRGHVDFQTAAGDLVEIKSVDWRGYEIVRQRGPKRPHRAQVQMYLRHGGWQRGFLVYVARDMPWQRWSGVPIWVFEEREDQVLGEALDEKARGILACVDSGEGEAPECECGRCKR